MNFFTIAKLIDNKTNIIKILYIVSFVFKKNKTLYNSEVNLLMSMFFYFLITVREMWVKKAKFIIATLLVLMTTTKLMRKQM